MFYLLEWCNVTSRDVWVSMVVQDCSTLGRRLGSDGSKEFKWPLCVILPHQKYIFFILFKRDIQRRVCSTRIISKCLFLLPLFRRREMGRLSETCSSGWRGTPGKCVYGKPYRGFESLSLRIHLPKLGSSIFAFGSSADRRPHGRVSTSKRL